MISGVDAAVAFLDGLVNLEYKHKAAILELYDNPADIFKNIDLAVDYLEDNLSRAAANTFFEAINSGATDEIIDALNRDGVTPVTIFDDNYPTRLKYLDYRPLCLYAKGDLSLLNSDKTVGIVGSRKTLPEYAALTKNVSECLSGAGVTVVTGVAFGADKAAIQGALNSGKIICVTASGFNYLKSEANRDLIEKVIENGLCITEYPPSVPPLAYHYPVRNRIIAGLSDGVLIAGGDRKSGARHTADYALDYGVDVMAFPYAVGVTGGELCNSLIKDGAHLVETSKDVAEVLGVELKNDKNDTITLSDKEKSVYDIIAGGSGNADEILLKTGFKVYELTPILTMLELKGLILKGAGGEYKPVKGRF